MYVMKVGCIWLWSRAVIGRSMSPRMTAQETSEQHQHGSQSADIIYGWLSTSGVVRHGKLVL
ncbi:hypothetical protein RG72_24475 (plasmid) [Escherichia coli]|nr:hypothetical protein RG72_24475 [Escherichia coli]